MRFVGQPFAPNPNLIDFILSARDEGYDDLFIAVAWAKRSGLGRMWDALDDFRNQGGSVTLIVGVSEGGATREGLELALKIADRGYVFHDPRRTFHPKVYFASSSGKRSLMVGSSNLTAGGLGWNYEASLWIDWAAGEGKEVTDGVFEWFEMLTAATDSCVPLTADLIDLIERSVDISLGSEQGARRVQQKKSDTPEDNDSAMIATVSGLFKSGPTGLRKLPSLSERLLQVPNETVAVGSLQSTAKHLVANKSAQSGATPLTTEDVYRRWFKRLDNTGAQQVKSANSKPTGNLRLSREGAAIDHKTYFRDDFFGGLPWTPTDGKGFEQEVLVNFYTWIDGQSLGPQELRLSHDPHRISGQGNVPTVLHWGDLGKILRESSYVGFYVTIERLKGSGFNLIIADETRGEYRV